MKLKQILVALASAVAVAMVVASPAGASVNIPENPVPISTGAPEVIVPVAYSGFTPNTQLIINQCKKDPTDASFNLSGDCSTWTQINVNPIENTGSGTLDFELFRGDEPTGDKAWGCYSEDQTPTAGYEKFTTCYIRVTQGSPTNNAEAQGTAFTFVVQGAPIPEAPLAIVLPLVAGVVLAAAFVMNRRRTAHPAL